MLTKCSRLERAKEDSGSITSVVQTSDVWIAYSFALHRHFLLEAVILHIMLQIITQRQQDNKERPDVLLAAETYVKRATAT